MKTDGWSVSNYGKRCRCDGCGLNTFCVEPTQARIPDLVGVRTCSMCLEVIETDVASTLGMRRIAQTHPDGVKSTWRPDIDGVCGVCPSAPHGGRSTIAVYGKSGVGFCQLCARAGTTAMAIFARKREKARCASKSKKQSHLRS